MHDPNDVYDTKIYERHQYQYDVPSAATSVTLSFHFLCEIINKIVDALGDDNSHHGWNCAEISVDWVVNGSVVATDTANSTQSNCVWHLNGATVPSTSVKLPSEPNYSSIYGSYMDMDISRKIALPANSSLAANITLLRRHYDLGGTAAVNCKITLKGEQYN